MWETQVWSLGWEDPLEKGMAIHSSILAWNIPWMLGGLQFMRSQRVRHDWVTNSFTTVSTCYSCSLIKLKHLFSFILWGSPVLQVGSGGFESFAVSFFDSCSVFTLTSHWRKARQPHFSMGVEQTMDGSLQGREGWGGDGKARQWGDRRLLLSSPSCNISPLHRSGLPCSPCWDSPSSPAGPISCGGPRSPLTRVACPSAVPAEPPGETGFSLGWKAWLRVPGGCARGQAQGHVWTEALPLLGPHTCWLVSGDQLS